MAYRDSELGPFGLYDEQKTKEVGLRKALLDTAEHLDVLISVTKAGKKRDEMILERNRLKARAGSER